MILKKDMLNHPQGGKCIRLRLTTEQMKSCLLPLAKSLILSHYMFEMKKNLAHNLQDFSPIFFGSWIEKK